MCISFQSFGLMTDSFSGAGHTIHCAAVAVQPAGVVVEAAVDFELHALRDGRGAGLELGVDEDAAVAVGLRT